MSTSTTNVRTIAGKGGMEVFVLEHESGTVAEVYSHGATITSVKTAGDQQLLFLSEAANFDGKSPIRGGVPLIFPKFGGGWEGDSNPSSLPSHGFARRCTWKLDIADDTVGFVLDHTMIGEEFAKQWPFKFKLRAVVQLGEHGYTQTLEVTNTGDATFPFQALVHTYYALETIGGASVNGLAGRTFVDKLEPGADKVQGEGDVTFTQETDRIYRETGNASSVTLTGLAGGAKVAKIGFSSTGNTVDCVVWNPWDKKAASMGDFGDEEYHTMCCVEPGYVSKPYDLGPSESFSLVVDSQLVKPSL